MENSKAGRIVIYVILAWLTVAGLVLVLQVAPGLAGAGAGAEAVGAAAVVVGVWLAVVLWIELRYR